jgi:hypothetical protein
MDKTAIKITALLVQKNNMDASRDSALNMGVGSNAEHQWLLDAVELLLRAEFDRRPQVSNRTY